MRFYSVKPLTSTNENRVLLIGRRINGSKLTEAIRSQWSDQSERRESN